MRKEKMLKKSLMDTILRLRPDLQEKRNKADEEEAEEEDLDSLPFVCHKFAVIGASNSA